MTKINEVNIHPSAHVEKGAELGSGVSIGPFSYVGSNVKLGNRCKVHSNVVLSGIVHADEENHFHPFCSIGGAPQDLSYKDEPTKVVLGKNNIFREYVSVNRGTLKQDGMTIVGNNCLIMSYSHLAHDVCMGDFVRVVNSCNFAGHVKIGDKAIISGGTNVSQFISIGKGAFIGGGSAVDKDIPCYSVAMGNRVQIRGINIVGLKRLGIEKNVISEVVDFYRTMEIAPTSPKTFCLMPETVQEYGHNVIIAEMMEFILQSQIGLPSFMS